MGIPRFTPARCPHLSSERTFQRGTQFRKTFVRMFVRNDFGHVCPYGFTKSWLEHDFRVWSCVTSSSWPYSRARLAIVVVSIFCRGFSIPLDALFRFVSPPPTPPPFRRSSGVFRSVSVRVSKNTRKKLGPPNDENVKNIRRRSRGKSEMFLLLIYSWRPF